MSMTPVESTTRTCRFPGCERPAADSSGVPGRPPEYCEDPGHTALKAWRARRTGTGVGPAEVEDLGRPVSMATARAGMLREELGSTAKNLVDQLQRILADLQTMSDPDAAAAQIETVTSEAGEQIAHAEAARSRAEAAERQARNQLAEADDAAQDLESQLARLEEVLTEAGSQRDAARAEAAAQVGQIEQLNTELAQSARELATVEQARAQAGTQIVELTAALAAARDEASAATARAKEVQTRSAAAVADLEQRLTVATVRAEQLGEQLGDARVHLESARADSARLHAQLEAATQRAEEATARAERSETTREQSDRDRSTAEKAATKLDAQLEQARTRVSELTDEHRTLADALTDATDRAARAEARLAITGPADTGKPVDTGRAARRPAAPSKATARAPRKTTKPDPEGKQ